jgi:hypothetical protein
MSVLRDPAQRLTAREATRWLRDRTGVKPSIATIHRWAGKGVRGSRLRAQRVGGVLYIAPVDLEAFLASCDARGPKTTVPTEMIVRNDDSSCLSAGRRQQITATAEALRARLGRSR